LKQLSVISFQLSVFGEEKTTITQRRGGRGDSQRRERQGFQFSVVSSEFRRRENSGSWDWVTENLELKTENLKLSTEYL
jgi:hypothetical protein